MSNGISSPSSTTLFDSAVCKSVNLIQSATADFEREALFSKSHTGITTDLVNLIIEDKVSTYLPTVKKMFRAAALKFLALNNDIKRKHASFAKFSQFFGKGDEKEQGIAKVVRKKITDLSGSDRVKPSIRFQDNCKKFSEIQNEY